MLSLMLRILFQVIYFVTVAVFLKLVSSTKLFAYFKSIQAMTFVYCLYVELLHRSSAAFKFAASRQMFYSL